jgi:hypothetical protein
MIRSFALLLLLVLLLLTGSLSPVSGGEQPYDLEAIGAIGLRANFTHLATTDMKMEFSWKHNEPKPKYYESHLWSIDRKVQIPLPNTTKNSVVASFPWAGLFVFKVRACNDDECGKWSPSTDPAYSVIVNGKGEVKPQAWWIYGYLAPPGEIVNEN